MTLQVRAGVSLKPFNSFGVDVTARLFAEAHSDGDVRQALAYGAEHAVPLLVIGGGSNLLLTGDIDALVLRMASHGIRLLSDDGERVVVEAEAGEPWHPFVQHTLAQGWSGLENLSLIPGTVGAAPMQNIGAYGVEIKDVFAGLTALDRQTGELREFTLEECCFAYRDSVFKQQVGRWLILRVRFALSRAAHLHLEYGPVRQRLTEQGIDQPTPTDVSRAICSIRSENSRPGRAGQCRQLLQEPAGAGHARGATQAAIPDLVAYPQPGGQMKIAAGWLIERAGWKGFREGDAGVHKLQALVLVNYGSATGPQLLDLALRIQKDIAERFQVELEMEPNRY
ncbi:UDP-N-acetylmuramate dehydrogenase [Pseudomonas sp. NA13]